MSHSATLATRVSPRWRQLFWLPALALLPAFGYAATEPTTQPTLSYSPSSGSAANTPSALIKLSGGNGSNRLVVVRPSSAAAVAPTDGAVYVANAAYGLGTTTGTNNYVVLAAGSATTSVLVTGLTSGTTYAIDVYSYNTDLSAPVTNYLAAAPATFTFTARPTYRWNVASGNISGTAANWTPSRTGATNDDILVFDGDITASVGSTVTVNGGFTARQLYFVNNANATLYVTAGRTVTLNGNEGDDFEVEAGSTARFGSTTKNDDLTLTLNGSATAEIGGTLIFENYSGAPGQQESNHRLTGPSGSVVFRDGATFRMAPGALGNPFGTNNAIATFQSGSTYLQQSGSDPFGPNGTGAVSFQAGSTYVFAGGSFSTNGRTYGNVEFQGNATVSGSAALVVLNDLIVTSGTVALNTTNVNFNGTGAQTIGGSGGSLSFGGRLNLNSPAGTTLQRAATLGGGLSFGASAGKLINTGGGLVIPTAVTITGTDNTRFIEGSLSRTTSGGGNITSSNGNGLFFPIGTPGFYGPITLTLTQAAGSGAATFTAVPVADRAPSRALPTGPNDLQRVSGVRYYSLSTNASFTNGQLALGFQPIDQVDAPSTLRLAQGVGANWVNLGGTVTPTQADGTTFLSGTITSGTAFTSLGDFVLASTSLSNAPGNNPLPVELLSLKATRQGGLVAISWLTAQELNNARFEVQRSRDGRQFERIGEVAGQGTKASPTDYTFLDNQVPKNLSPQAPIYYRLRQLDFDGTSTLSEIVAVDGLGQFAVSLYPNPARQELTVLLGTEPVQWRVLNLLGQPLRTGQAQGRTTLSLDGLPAGSYCLEISGGSRRSVQKFIKAD